MDCMSFIFNVTKIKIYIVVLWYYNSTQFVTMLESVSGMLSFTSANLRPACRNEDSSRAWTLATLMEAGDAMGESTGEVGEEGSVGGKSWYRWHSWAFWVIDLKQTRTQKKKNGGQARLLKTPEVDKHFLLKSSWSWKKIMFLLKENSTVLHILELKR